MIWILFISIPGTNNTIELYKYSKEDELKINYLLVCVTRNNDWDVIFENKLYEWEEQPFLSFISDVKFKK